MRRYYAVVALGLIACVPPIKYYQNNLHPERSFEQDKYNCDLLATIAMNAAYPRVTLYNMGYAKIFYDYRFESCLISFGWLQVKEE